MNTFSTVPMPDDSRACQETIPGQSVGEAQAGNSTDGKLVNRWTLAAVGYFLSAWLRKISIGLALSVTHCKRWFEQAKANTVQVNPAALKHFVLLVIVAMLATAPNLFGREAGQLSDAEINRMVAAIYRIEGGDKARVPYGILSVKVKDKESARRVCYNTVRNNYVRWTKSGKPDDFAKFIAARYCPPSADAVGHKNWVNNFRKIVGKVQ
jgi:hypothetical protein